ncbi:MAG: hypothetical protein QX189_02300 [Methylococcales bacterium]
MKTVLIKTHSYLILLLALLLMTGCGAARKNPVASAIETVFAIPSVVLSVPSAILTANPNKIKNTFDKHYNSVTGQCTGNANYNAPECVTIRQQQEIAKKQQEIAGLKAMPLPQLDSYYETEIANNSKEKSKEVADLVKNRLVEENIKLGTFQGCLRAAQISGNPRYVTEHINLARTVEDKKSLEQFTVLHTDDLNNFFDVDFKPKLGKSGTRHTEYTGLLGFFLDHSDAATKEISGILNIARSKTAPSELSLGYYKLTINITMHLPSKFIRQSDWGGNANENIDHTETTTVTANVGSPNMSASKNINFTVETAGTKRGRQGGADQRVPTGEPTFVVDIVKAEVI